MSEEKLFDAIIVGAGPTGVSAAMALAEKGKKPLILDVGKEPPPRPAAAENFYDFRQKNDAFDIMIGENYDGLHNILHNDSLSPKLTAPLLRYVTAGAGTLSPVKEEGFRAIQSFAAGGLANAWGAGLFRYSDRELQDMPIDSAELAPYYDKLTREIGILGADDDLTPFFGSTNHLLPPLELSEKSARLYRKYRQKRESLNSRGIFLGHPRLGILSTNHQGRTTTENVYNLDAWLPHIPAVYNPVFTLEKLVAANRAWYRKGILVTSWQRKKDALLIRARDIASDSPVSFKARRLLLAAGTINTARIVLATKKDHESELKLLDNPMVQVPLLFPGFIGKRLERGPFGMGHLNMVFDLKKHNLLVQGNIVEVSSPARALFWDQFPFSASHNIRLVRTAANALLVMLLFFPSSEENAARLRLAKNGCLEVRCRPYRLDKEVIKTVCAGVRKLGVFTAARFCQYSPPGYGIHYAGTMPMKARPASPYQCNKNGELFGEPGVHIVDGSLLERIPAKNLSLTLMANAMRIAAALTFP